MKNILKALTGSLLMMALFSSCKKDEHQVTFEGGTNPVLTASSTTAQILLPANQANQALKFTWTNPNYQFNTGISSQDVTYILQVDTTGANFTSPLLQEVSISKELSVSFTVKELNTILTKLNLQEDMVHSVEFRIKSTLVNNSVPLYSNVIKINITPYLDVAIPIPVTGVLYITGDACPSDWTNSPPLAQKCTKVSNTEYNITMTFAPGKYYKFLTNLGQWQPQYGLKSGSGGNASGGDLGLNNLTPQYPSDPDAIPTAAVGGSYKVTLNFKTGKYTVVKL